jgi:LSD1 subclass zinc finger protein
MAVPASYDRMSCPACGTIVDFVRCPSCRWPLPAIRGVNAVRCPGCGARSKPAGRGGLPATAGELSYFRGLSGVRPADSEVAWLPACTSIATWGLSLRIGSLVSLATTAQDLHLTPISTGKAPIIWPLASVLELRFDGPGLRTQGRQFWGGGFGLVGAAEGILAAELMSRLTTTTTVNAQVHIELDSAGAILHTSQRTPAQLRTQFAGPLARIGARRQQPAAPEHLSYADQLEHLEALHRSGALTSDEYARAKAKVLDS